MKINCVVVTYNRLDLLKENLEMLDKQTFPLNHIVIINNCSTDGTEEYLKQYANNPKYTVIKTEENVGGAGGFSLGLKTSVQLGCDYTWMMDDDTIPQLNAVEELIPAINEHQNIGFISSRVNWTDNTPHELNRPKLVDEQAEEAYPKCVSCSFVAVLVSTQAVLKVGLPIKEFFIWCDDVEYTERIYHAGFNCYLAPKSIVVHKTATNYVQTIDKAPKNIAWRFYYQARNLAYMKRQKYSCKLFFYISVWSKYRRYKRRLKNRDESERAAFLDAVRRGTKDGLKFNPPIEYVKL